MGRFLRLLWFPVAKSQSLIRAPVDPAFVLFSSLYLDLGLGHFFDFILLRFPEPMFWFLPYFQLPFRQMSSSTGLCPYEIQVARASDSQSLSHQSLRLCSLFTSHFAPCRSEEYSYWTIFKFFRILWVFPFPSPVCFSLLASCCVLLCFNVIIDFYF